MDWTAALKARTLCIHVIVKMLATEFFQCFGAPLIGRMSHILPNGTVCKFNLFLQWAVSIRTVYRQSAEKKPVACPTFVA